jgi:hypothetical protein
MINFDLITKAGFNKSFDELLAQKPNLKRFEVFDILNSEYEKMTGEKRYSNYHSFSIVRRNTIIKKVKS